MRTSHLSEAWNSGRASSKALARTVADHARGAAHDIAGRAHHLRGRATAFRARPETRSFAPKSLSLGALGSLGGLGRRKTTMLATGGVLLGLAAGGFVAWSLARKAREKKLAGTAEIAPPADKLGRDAAHQGESAGLAEFVEPQSAPFPLAGARRAKSRTSVSTEH